MDGEIKARLRLISFLSSILKLELTLLLQMVV
jgi:hypothetical protein